MESKPLDLDVFWSPNLQLWTYFGVQTFSFGTVVLNRVPEALDSIFI
ncbi:hypothetical protein QUF54_03590 [Candidatus Marithioploca araucensis]|uniref:Uncharacterized protein n=1 Tax=Candidatus Marithioploca araucensis TaxID=70273 RepID=A0ABT7VRW5_9GAMM|nr:hypothetical protein [Candidatus Marithioploca araucensis]